MVKKKMPLRQKKLIEATKSKGRGGLLAATLPHPKDQEIPPHLRTWIRAKIGGKEKKGGTKGESDTPREKKNKSNTQTARRIYLSPFTETERLTSRLVSRQKNKENTTRS